MERKPTKIYYSGHAEPGRQPEECIPNASIMLTFYDIYFKKNQAPRRLHSLQELKNETNTNKPS